MFLLVNFFGSLDCDAIRRSGMIRRYVSSKRCAGCGARGTRVFFSLGLLCTGDRRLWRNPRNSLSTWGAAAFLYPEDRQSLVDVHTSRPWVFYSQHGWSELCVYVHLGDRRTADEICKL